MEGRGTDVYVDEAGLNRTSFRDRAKANKMSMKEDNMFDISFKSGDMVYSGWVNPSQKLNDSGTPVSFHVVLNDTSFGYLSYRDCKWMINEDRPDELVELVGEQIEKHYQL